MVNLQFYTSLVGFCYSYSPFFYFICKFGGVGRSVKRGFGLYRSTEMTKQLDLRSEHAGNVHATWPGFPWPNRFTPVLPLVRKHTNAVVQPLPPP
ncbi:hypothetical protein ANTQUA_LOCUS338 [Anthophora quadrimaculata]